MEGSDRPRIQVGNTMATGRLPNPGNAEFVLYVLANLLASIVVGFADTLNVNDWFQFFLFTTVDLHPQPRRRQGEPRLRELGLTP